MMATQSTRVVLCVLLCACGPSGGDSDAGQGPDGATTDAAIVDGSTTDAAIVDGSTTDAAIIDGSAADSSTTDAAASPDATPGPDASTLIGLPYPDLDPYRIKGIQPDFWADTNELVSHNTGVVSMNTVWATWEPAAKAPPCAASQQEYDGHCFTIDTNVDQAIRTWTNAGVMVTAIVYGVPAWARTANVGCSPAAAGFEIFCTPDDASNYGRFAGMLASRYDGLSGNGRIANFVVHNEVNSNTWFDIGCGQGTPCNATTWIQTYVDNYAAAYDAIKLHQAEAKVLMSFEHHFGTAYDQPAATDALLSVQTFVTQFAGLIGDREWQLAYHPYAPDLFSPVFSPLDWPRVTYGNLGSIIGWLRATFPGKPHAWQVQLTESGISSGTPQSSEAAQATAVCDTLRNVLGTPGITSYIYHRMKDHPAEGGLKLGLRREDGTAKPAWAAWALSNHINDVPPQLSCGFEHLPYTRLARSYNPGTGRHWSSSRRAPAGFTEESAWYLHREAQPGTKLLLECLVDSAAPHTFPSFNTSCEGQRNMGPVGYIWTAPFAGSIALYRCITTATGDHYISPDAACEGGTTEQLLGYAKPTN